ncbi:hypothetical protein Tsubulata_036036 [Turnera subulata]|uniref:NAC domain-containing protein n=1 Tax=Turnera subulata TaxID=218843 RepID=A0A9Q0EYB9_9ROSI|nr:hypothetical protein Tsubulata_036036 [Turnera subulata]
MAAEEGDVGGVSRETQMSIEASSMFPGFRFSPTDSELISYYLKKKMEGAEKCVEVIPEVEICQYEPWDLPGKSVVQSDNEWFFFSARGRKYPNGTQSKRATELGYWKATGKERNVKSGASVIGTKRTLVFHVGRAPKGERTEWIMHEFCMHNQDSLVVCRLRKNIDFRQNEGSSRAPARRASTTHENRSVNAADGGGSIDDHIALLEGDKNAESSKKSSSSYDSYSIEQFDSASESEQKHSNDVTLAESSSHQQEWDKEEDFYADILKDDIVKLDETSLSSAAPELLPFVVSMAGAATRPQQTLEAITTQVAAAPLRAIPPHQGTANRRIKLKKNDVARGGEIPTKPTSKKESPKCVIDFTSIMSGKRGFVPAVIVILALLLLLFYLSGGYQLVMNMASKM